MALLLGLVGLYGVTAYSVSQRTREIGVRIALGAERKAVYALILKEAGLLTTIGIVTGLAGALAATTLMRKLLLESGPGICRHSSPSQRSSQSQRWQHASFQLAAPRP